MDTYTQPVTTKRQYRSLEEKRRIVGEALAEGASVVDCTPKVRHEFKGPITLNGGEQCLCPDNSIPAN